MRRPVGVRTAPTISGAHGESSPMSSVHSSGARRSCAPSGEASPSSTTVSSTPWPAAVLRRREAAILPDDDPRDLVEQRGARAHEAGRERRVEHAGAVDRGRLPPGVLEAVGLPVPDRRCRAAPAGCGRRRAPRRRCDQGRADRDAALVPPDAGLLDRQAEGEPVEFPGEVRWCGGQGAWRSRVLLRGSGGRRGPSGEAGGCWLTPARAVRVPACKGRRSPLTERP